jgi:hypothetical protein
MQACNSAPCSMDLAPLQLSLGVEWSAFAVQQHQWCYHIVRTPYLVLLSGANRHAMHIMCPASNILLEWHSHASRVLYASAFSPPGKPGPTGALPAAARCAQYASSAAAVRAYVVSFCIQQRHHYRGSAKRLGSSWVQQAVGCISVQPWMI